MRCLCVAVWIAFFCVKLSVSSTILDIQYPLVEDNPNLKDQLQSLAHGLDPSHLWLTGLGESVLVSERDPEYRALGLVLDYGSTKCLYSLTTNKCLVPDVRWASVVDAGRGIVAAALSRTPSLLILNAHSGQIYDHLNLDSYFFQKGSQMLKSVQWTQGGANFLEPPIFASACTGTLAPANSNDSTLPTPSSFGQNAKNEVFYVAATISARRESSNSVGWRDTLIVSFINITTLFDNTTTVQILGVYDTKLRFPVSVACVAETGEIWATAPKLWNNQPQAPQRFSQLALWKHQTSLSLMDSVPDWTQVWLKSNSGRNFVHGAPSFVCAGGDSQVTNFVLVGYDTGLVYGFGANDVGQLGNAQIARTSETVLPVLSHRADPTHSAPEKLSVATTSQSWWAQLEGPLVCLYDRAGARLKKQPADVASWGNFSHSLANYIPFVTSSVFTPKLTTKATATDTSNSAQLLLGIFGGVAVVAFVVGVLVFLVKKEYITLNV